MKTLGWIYIVAYCIDAVVSLVASFIPGAETLSNIISAPVAILSVVILILACIGKLKPQKTFLVLSSFYLLLLGFGIVLGVLLVAKLGPSIASQKVTIVFLREHFGWYGPVHWILMGLWLLVSVFGIHTYRKAGLTTEPEPDGDGLKPAP